MKLRVFEYMIVSFAFDVFHMNPIVVLFVAFKVFH